MIRTYIKFRESLAWDSSRREGGRAVLSPGPPVQWCCWMLDLHQQQNHFSSLGGVPLEFLTAPLLPPGDGVEAVGIACPCRHSSVQIAGLGLRGQGCPQHLLFFLL